MKTIDPFELLFSFHHQYFFWLMSPQFSSIDKIIYSSSSSNLHKLPSLYLDKLYQQDGGSKLSIDIISEEKVFLVLVGEYLWSTIGSEILFPRKYVWVIVRHFITRSSWEFNDDMITKCRPSAERIVLQMNNDMTVFVKNYQYHFVKK